MNPQTSNPSDFSWTWSGEIRDWPPPTWYSRALNHWPLYHFKPILVGSWQHRLWKRINQLTGLCDCGSLRNDPDCRLAWESE